VNFDSLEAADDDDCAGPLGAGALAGALAGAVADLTAVGAAGRRTGTTPFLGSLIFDKLNQFFNSQF
jgi:hypothetical protein